MSSYNRVLNRNSKLIILNHFASTEISYTLISYMQWSLLLTIILRGINIVGILFGSPFYHCTRTSYGYSRMVVMTRKCLAISKRILKLKISIIEK